MSDLEYDHLMDDLVALEEDSGVILVQFAHTACCRRNA